MYKLNENDDDGSEEEEYVNQKVMSTSIVQGEAPESDDEAVSTKNNDKKAETTTDVRKSIHVNPHPSDKRDSASYKNLINLNKSLRMKISSQLLHPHISKNTKTMDRISQNISNTQSDIQDTLLQLRLTTGNLYNLQKELEVFSSRNYLKDLK